MLVIRGHGELASRLVSLIGVDHYAHLRRGSLPGFPIDRLFVTQGLLTDDDVDAWRVNFHEVALLCDYVLEHNPAARICLMGSESAYRGSHCQPYAIAKGALHRYVESRRVLATQQLVAISPGIISDAGMTTRREDQARVAQRAVDHPKGRHVSSAEVAALAYYLLYLDRGYLSGVVIRMHGQNS